MEQQAGKPRLSSLCECISKAGNCQIIFNARFGSPQRATVFIPDARLHFSSRDVGSGPTHREAKKKFFNILFSVLNISLKKS